MFKSLFTGKLLRLSSPTAEDQATFAAWAQNDDYLRHLDDDPVRPLSSASFSNFGEPQDENSYYFHLRTLAEDKLIGFVVLFNIKWGNQTADMAIGIGDSEYRGKGYGRDALQLILNYAFAELNLHRVGLTVMEYNEAAIRAYERVGFVREGVQRQMVQREGRRYDLLTYGILRDEWG